MGNNLMGNSKGKEIKESLVINSRNQSQFIRE